MIIDVSTYQGDIDWKKVSESGVQKVILRSTLKSGNLDPRFMKNYNGILQNINATMKELDMYKFSYSRDYIGAYMEAVKTFETLKDHGVRLQSFDYFWLDLEAWDGRDYTTAEANAVIHAYEMACKKYGVQLGLYCNYNYIKHIIDPYWRTLPLWIARYNKTLGDIKPFEAYMWQYTDKGVVDGIPAKVDLSRYI